MHRYLATTAGYCVGGWASAAAERTGTGTLSRFLCTARRSLGDGVREENDKLHHDSAPSERCAPSTFGVAKREADELGGGFA